MSQRQYVFFAAIVAAIGGLLFGFDVAVISGAGQYLQGLFTPYERISERAEVSGGHVFAPRLEAVIESHAFAGATA